MSARNVANGIALALATLTLVVGLTSALLEPTAANRLFVDWFTYANAFDRWMNGGSIYAASQLSGPYFLPDVVRVGYAYPPVTVPLFAPWTTYPIGALAWVVANAGVLTTGILAAIKRSTGTWNLLTVAAVIAVLGILPPFTNGVVTGNINVALAGLLAWAWALGRDSRWIAVFAAGGAISKLTPGVLIGFSRARSRPALYMLAMVAVVVMVTVPLVGTQSWVDFVRALGNAKPGCALPRALPAMPCIIASVTGADVARIATLGSAGVLTIVAWLAKDDLVAFVLIAAAWIVPVPDVHPHTLLVPVVVAVVAAAEIVARIRHRQLQGNVQLTQAQCPPSP